MERNKLSLLLAEAAVDGLKRGIVILCIGGGQGISLAIETLS